MDFAYVAYTEDRKLVKGKISAADQGKAGALLGYSGYEVVSLKAITPFVDTSKVLSISGKVKSSEIVLFSRQLALLLESGTDIVTSLELIQAQSTNRTFKTTLEAIANDIRGGSSVSAAMGKHPRVFSRMYSQSIAAGEYGGNLEVVLRQMADYIERDVNTKKKVKSALNYPIVVIVVAIAVVAVLVTTVFPTFVDLYKSLGTELPLATKMLISFTEFSNTYGLYFLAVIAVIVIVFLAYIRRPKGRLRWHEWLLRLPVVGRINLLTELASCARTISMLFKVGLPLPDIVIIASQSSNNRAVAKALTEVHQEMMAGEGLSKPMGRRKLFLPMLVQMVNVGEQTGKLDNTLTTVAQTYDADADDRLRSAIAMIQPIITIVIGLVVAFIAVSLISAMYSIYSGIGA